jgi:hypothetical protein
MAQLTVKSATIAGVASTYVAASAGGDSFANNGHTVFHVKNGGASAITVTVNSQTACNHGFDHDITVSVAAGEERIIGTFDRSRFNDATGNVLITYSAVTTVTVCAISTI